MKSPESLSLVALMLFPIPCFASVHGTFVEKVERAFQTQPRPSENDILTEKDIAHLPEPVQKYLRYTGSVGKPKVMNARLQFDTLMFSKPRFAPMLLKVDQFSFFGDPARFFFMKGKMRGLPVRVLHAYSQHSATMQVRMLGLINLVNLSGEQLSIAETVTLLNDMCVLFPATLIDSRLSWKAVDATSVQVTFQNGPYRVSAMLIFNEKGELICFYSDDRLALQDDGSLRKARWSTPLRDYKEFNGRRVASYGEAIWNYPEGDFTYGIFDLTDIRYNVPGLE